jgi:hypothetical protein
MELAEFCLKRKEVYDMFRERFYHVFHKQLKPYWSNLTGLDVIKLDELVNPQKNESTHDAILRQWGTPGGDLITAMLDAETAILTGAEIIAPTQPKVKIGDTVEFFTLYRWKQAVVISIELIPTVRGKAGTFDTVIYFDPMQIGPEEAFKPTSDWNLNCSEWRIIASS